MNEPCPICKSPNTRNKYTLTGYSIAVCGECSFEFNDGFKGGGGDDGMFSQEYYEGLQSDAFKAQYGDYTKDPSAPVYLRWLGELEKMTPPGRILDVGSALGTFLKIAESRGWKPQGVEISRFAAEFARRERGIEVFNGDLEAFGGADGSFDVVTFWDSLEHVTHPFENLCTASLLVRRNGYILLTTDNFDCLLADCARISYRASFGALRYSMERVFIPPNRSYFTEATLRDLLRRCGLDVVVFEKMEYPLAKIRSNWMEHLILKGFYAAASLLRREAQVTVIAQKR